MKHVLGVVTPLHLLLFEWSLGERGIYAVHSHRCFIERKEGRHRQSCRAFARKVRPTAMPEVMREELRIKNDAAVKLKTGEGALF